MPSLSPTPFLGLEKEKELIGTALAPAPRRKTSSSRIIRPSTAPSTTQSHSSKSTDSPLSTQSATLTSLDSQPQASLLFQPSSATIQKPTHVRPSSALELGRRDDEIIDHQSTNGQVRNDKVTSSTVEINGKDSSEEKKEEQAQEEKQVDKRAASPWTLPIGGRKPKQTTTTSSNLAPTSNPINPNASPISVCSNLTDDDPVEQAQVIQVTKKPSLLSTRSPTPTNSPSRGLKSPLRRPSTADSAQSNNSSGGKFSAPPTPPPKSPRHMLKLHPVFDSTIPLPTRPATAPFLPSSATAPNLASSTGYSSTSQPISIPSVNILASQTPPTVSNDRFNPTSISADSALSPPGASFSPQSPGASSISSASSSSTHRVKRKPVPFENGKDETVIGRRNSTQSYDGLSGRSFEVERRASSSGIEGKTSPNHQRSPSGSDVMKAAQEAALAHIASRKASESSPTAQLAPLPSPSASKSIHRHSYSSILPQSSSTPNQNDVAEMANGSTSNIQKHSRPQRPSTAPVGSPEADHGSFGRLGRKQKASVLMIEGQTFLLDSPAARERAAALSRHSQDSNFTSDSFNEDRQSELDVEEGEGEEGVEMEDLERDGEGEKGGLDASEEFSRSSDDTPLGYEKQVEGNRNRSDTFNSSATSTTGSHRSPWSSLALNNKVRENLVKENDSSSFSTAPPTHSERQSEQLDREEEGEEGTDNDKSISRDSDVRSPTSPTTSTIPQDSMGPSLNSSSYRTAPSGVGGNTSSFVDPYMIQSSALEPEFEAEDVIYDFSEGGTRDPPPPGSYAIHPPTMDQLIQASNCVIFDENSKPLQFGQVFKEGRTLVCFLRHWWCGFCQEFAMSLASIDMLPLQRAGLGLVVIGQGSPHVTAAYKQVMNVPSSIGMYADPERNVYKALGMTLRTNDAGPACAVPDYVQSGMTKSIVVAIKRGLFDMPIRAPGDMKLLGGEFILGPGLQCSFTHRMVTTRGHLDLPRILAQAGCDMTLKSPKAVGEESIPSRPESTRSLGRSKSRLNLRRKKERQNKGGDFSDHSSMAGSLSGSMNNQLEKALSAHSGKSKSKRSSGKGKEPRERESSEISGSLSGRSSTLPFRKGKGLFGKLAIGNTSQTSLASHSIRSAATELYNPPSSFGGTSNSNSDQTHGSQVPSQGREVAPRSSLSFSVDEEKKEQGRFSKSKSGKAVTKAKSSVDLGKSTSPKTSSLSGRFSGLTSSSLRRPETSPQDVHSLASNGIKAKDTLTSSEFDPSSQSNFANKRDVQDEVVHITSLQPRPKFKSSNSLLSSSQEVTAQSPSTPVSTSSPSLSQSNDNQSTPRPNKLQHAFLDTDPSEMKGFKTPKPEEWMESNNSSSRSSPVQPASPKDQDAQDASEMDLAEKEFQENLRKKVRAAAGITEDLSADSFRARRDRFVQEELNGSGGDFGGSFLDGLDAFDALPGTRAREERYLDEMESTIEEEDESFLEDDEDEDEDEDEEPLRREESQNTLRSAPSKSSYPSTDDAFSDRSFSDHEEDELSNQQRSNGRSDWDSQSYSPDSESYDPKEVQLNSSKHGRSSSNGSSHSVASSTSSVGVASSNLHGSNWRPLDPTPRPSLLESVQNRRLSAFNEEEEEEEEGDSTFNPRKQDDGEADIHSYYEREVSIDSQRSREDEWKGGNQNGNGYRRDSFEEARTPLAKVNELPTEALWA